MVTKPTLKEMLAANVHYGHLSKHRNHKYGDENILMKYKNRDIINLHQTSKELEAAGTAMQNIIQKGGKALFVGCKKQAKDLIRAGAEKVGMPYIVERWTGGMLTNFENTKRRIKVLQGADKANLETHRTKKEIRIAEGRRKKLEKDIEGIVSLNRPPSALFVVDIRQEYTAVKEAHKLGIPTFALVDSNASPKFIDHAIPANDDAEKSIKLLTDYLFAKCAEGVKAYQAQKSSLASTITVPAVPKREVEEKTKRKRIKKSDLNTVSSATSAKAAPVTPEKETPTATESKTPVTEVAKTSAKTSEAKADKPAKPETKPVAKEAKKTEESPENPKAKSASPKPAATTPADQKEDSTPKAEKSTPTEKA